MLADGIVPVPARARWGGWISDGVAFYFGEDGLFFEGPYAVGEGPVPATERICILLRMARRGLI